MIDVNLAGVRKTVKAVVPHILSGGRGGSVILTNSVGGLNAYPHTGHYVDVSNAVLFFACDESRYITGVTLPIDAGSCLK